MEISQYNRAQRDLGLAKTKAVLNEVVYSIYMDALPIDDKDQYANSLRETVNAFMDMEIYNECTDKEDIGRKIISSPNITPITVQAVLLAETIANDAENDLSLKDDYPEIAIELSPDERKMVTDFKKLQGTEEVGHEILEKVMTTFSEEAELVEMRNSEAEALISEKMAVNDADDDLGNGDDTDDAEVLEDPGNDDVAITDDVVTEAVNAVSGLPKTLVQAIYEYKSRTMLNENASGKLADVDEVMAETAVTYALFETINSLGLKTYTDRDINNLTGEFFAG